MAMRSIRRHWGWWATSVLVAAGVITAGALYLNRRPVSASPDAGPAAAGARPDEQRVEVVKPRPGGVERVSAQPGSVQAFESVDLYAKVPGFLESQTVDIGSRISKGQELARLSVPEYEKEVQRDAADLERARANVQQMEARLANAEAEARVAAESLPQAQAVLGSATAMRSYRTKQFNRIKNLSEQENAVEQKLVDEEHDRREAAVETENAARAGVATAEAQLAAARAKVDVARADLADARAKVEVALADLEKARVMAGFAKIAAPFDGVVTKRHFFPGDFVRAATTGGLVPLLSVERTDRLRVVVQVPDRDVPFADVGDEAVVEVDALPGRKFKAAISRMADSEDPQTRTMRVEIDLDNAKRELRPGMYGRVTITLQKGAASAFTIPSDALVGRSEDGQGSVYVVRDGRLHLAQLHLGSDDGIHCEVLGGLSADDQVVVNHNGSLEEGVAVEAVPARQAPAGHAR